jgi:hypothetical protein
MYFFLEEKGHDMSITVGADAQKEKQSTQAT